jgi:hypothetical protein
MAATRLRWVISGPGSANLLWTLEASTVRIHTTYVGDALGSVMRAAIDLRIGSSSTYATFEGEPGGTRVFFNRSDDQGYVQIVDFPRMSSKHSWEGGVLRWSGCVPVAEFVEGVRAMAEAILSEHGESGYARLWGGIPFPMRQLTVLQTTS